MKKFFAMLLSGLLLAASLVAISCGETNSASYTVYAPDGAPALALANAIHEEGEEGKFDFRVINAADITAQVTGNAPAADFCILPVNAAAKLLGNGESYQMLGTVTNGNMYFLTTGDNPALTKGNFATALKGKTVGVVQLNNVPGLTLQAVCKRENAAYAVLGNDTQADAEKINFKPIADAATGVTPAGGCDYYLCPEPARSAKIKGTASSPNPLKAAGSLQELYGENGYPQAVLVAKKSVIDGDKNAVSKMISYLEGSAAFLEASEPNAVVTLLDGCRTAGLTPAFNANNLTKEVIANCSVSFSKAADCKQRVNAFLAELIAVNPSFTSAVSEAFYYGA